MSIKVAQNESAGSLTGSILMIAGCCIGAGMISLPAITAIFGFFPSILILIIAWAFMISTGLLLLEVNLLFPKNTNLLTMTQSILGTKGKNCTAGLFVFIFFSLLIAYLSGSGVILIDFINSIFSLNLSAIYGACLCALLLLYILIKGASFVDWINRVFILGMVISYIMLVILGVKNIHSEYIARSYFSKQMLFSLPVFLISFGYQNLIPSITTYLGKHKRNIQIAIIVGCSVPFFIYLVWELIILGMLSKENAYLLSTSGDSEFIIQFLQKTIQSPYLFLFIQLFSLFALLTSLITVGLSFRDFVRDKNALSRIFEQKYFLPFLIVVIPFLFSIVIPNLFLRGLSLAGGLGVVILFGVIPIWMCWKVRYKQSVQSDHILPGGKISLVILMIISILIFSIELLRQLNITF